MPPEKKKRIARETLDIYAPIANRLGINRLKVQLEDLGFKHLHPFRYRVLETALKKSQGSQRQIVKRVSDEFSKAMADEGIKGEGNDADVNIRSSDRAGSLAGDHLASHDGFSPAFRRKVISVDALSETASTSISCLAKLRP